MRPTSEEKNLNLSARMIINTNIQSIAQRILNTKAKMVKVGIDEHARDVVVCFKLDGSQPMRAIKLAKDGLLAVLGQLRQKGLEVRSCYEAGPCGFVLHRKLEAAGVGNIVIAPQKLGGGKRQKTDALDALSLVELLDAHLRGSTKAFTRAYVPTPEQEQARAQGRAREAFKRERQSWEARGRSLMLAQGHHQTGQWWKPRRWETLRETLPGWLAQLLEPMRETILQLDQQEQTLRKTLEKKAPEKLPLAFGSLTWVQLLLEACDWKRFENRRQVGANTGLCPGIEQSGTKTRQGSINRHGNRRMRVLLIELVWRLVRWQPDYRPVRKLAEGVARGAARRKLAVAAARRLAIDIWRLSTGRTTPENLGLVMPAGATWQPPGQPPK
jgi:transposase